MEEFKMHLLVNLIFLVKKKKTCFYCKNLGDVINDCCKRIDNIRQGNIIVEDNRLYVAISLITKGKDPGWYINIGTTQHMAHEITFFSYKLWLTGQVVYLRDDTAHHIEGEGNVSIVVPNGQKKSITNVFHVLGLMKNLFSVKKLYEAKGEMIIKSKRCILKSPNGVIIANCMLENELYKLGITSQNCVKTIVVLTTTQSNKTKLWHKCLGHIC